MRNPMALRSQLTSLQKDILDELCESRVTRNAVLLTLDLVSRRRILRYGDPYGLVKDCIVQLNASGLCVYTAGDHDVPINIRPTKDGYHAAGHLLKVREIGGLKQMFKNRYSNDDASVLHPGDATDFRTQSYTTVGGPIERMSLAEHLAKYPDHRHYITEEDGMTSRSTFPQETQDRVVALLKAGAFNRDITAQTGVGQSAINTIAVDNGIYRGPRGVILTKEEYERAGALRGALIVAHKLDDAARSELIRQASEGVLAPELSKRFGISDERVRAILTAEGWASPGRGYPLAPPEGVVRKNGAGRSSVQLSPKERDAEFKRTPDVAPTVPEKLTMREEAQRITLLRHIVAEKSFHDVGVLTSKANKWPDVRLAGHEIAHVLWDLRKDEYVSFRETQTRGDMKLQSIRPTPKGERFIRNLDAAPTGNQNEKVQPKIVAVVSGPKVTGRTLLTPSTTVKETVETPAPVITPPPPVEPPAPPAAPDPARWPLLAALREKVAKGAKAKDRAERYIQAAALLEDPEDTDKLMVDSLISAAEALADTFRLSGVEAEYLEYSQRHDDCHG